jgi:integrase
VASIQKKGSGWYCTFYHASERYTFAIGKVDEAEAKAVSAKTDYLLMRMNQGLVHLPDGADIVQFVQLDGNLPKAGPLPETVFREFCALYLKAVGDGAIETNTLCTVNTHLVLQRRLNELLRSDRKSFALSDLRSCGPRHVLEMYFCKSYTAIGARGILGFFGRFAQQASQRCAVVLDHVARTLGESFAMGKLSVSHLQRHIDRRKKVVTGVTIKKEIDTLRTAWNWSVRLGKVKGDFPSHGLIYPKETDKLPLMTWTEIERRIAAGGDPDTLWECLYLTLPEIEEFLAFVKTRKAPPWFYPMILFAAHTGTRRSEMIRAMCEDVNLAEGVVTICEKKRVKGRLTTRRVPLSDTLAEELRIWMPGRISLFGSGAAARSVQGTQKAFVRAVKGSKWAVVPGYHALRHAFVSALVTKGVDQRIIEELAGHMDEKTSRRYRHLAPNLKADAIKSVFR